MTATSSRSLSPLAPCAASTPTTRSSVSFTVTVWPTTRVVPNSSLAVSGPSTTTLARFVSSSAVKNAPDAMVRPRTSSQSSVVPVTDVVQLVSPATSDADVVFSAATLPMSGAFTDEASASASAVVSVVREPKPPRMPVGRWCCCPA